MDNKTSTSSIITYIHTTKASSSSSNILQTVVVVE
jgi:hypothetical protein